MKIKNVANPNPKTDTCNESIGDEYQQQDQLHTVQIPNTNHTFTIKTRYTNLQPIGRGAYGLVVSAYDTIQRRHVAIKKIDSVFPNDSMEGIEESHTNHNQINNNKNNIRAKRLLREIKILQHFSDHDNIIQIYDVMIERRRIDHNAKRRININSSKSCHVKSTGGTKCSSTNTNAKQSNFSTVYIVLKLMESDLDQIIASDQVLSEKHVKYFLHQILRSIECVHSANVLHRDLKPSNLLVNSNCDVCLCDFGLARGISSPPTSSATTNSEDDAPAVGLTEYVVTRWYRAPELLCESSHYGRSADMWSVGCIFAELVTRKPLFKGKTPLHQLEIIIEILGCPQIQSARSTHANVDDDSNGSTGEELSFMKYSPPVVRDIINHARLKARPSHRGLKRHLPSSIDPDAFDLISKMLVLDPEKRICAKEALAHNYFNDFHNIKRNEIQCPPFNDDFERDYSMTAREIRAMIYEEEKLFHRSSVSESSTQRNNL